MSTRQPRMRRCSWADAGRLALILAVAGAGATAVRGPAVAAPAAVVKVGSLGVTSDVAIFIAMEKGLAAEEGLQIEFQRFGSGAKVVAPLATGELDVGSGTAAAGLYNAIAGGMDYKIVADKGQFRPGHEYVTLVVRKDLLDSGAVKSPADLRGRKVSTMTGRGVVSQYILGKILEHVQLPWNAVEAVDLAPPNQFKALVAKSVDAIVTAEPFGAKAEVEGVGKRMFMAQRVKALERLQIAVIQYSGKFMTQRRETAKRFMNAYVKGIRFYNERGGKSDEVVAILTKHLRVNPEDVRISTPFYLDPSGRPDVESLAAQQDWYHQMGWIKQKVAMERVVDLSFLQ